MIMKKLPQIFQGNIKKIKTNNKSQCVVSKETSKNIIEENSSDLIDSVFSGIGYSFNMPLCIRTTSGKKITSLIAKTKDSVITLDNEVIPLSEILSVTRKKN